MYINLPNFNFDIFHNIRIFLIYKYPDIIEKNIQSNLQMCKINKQLKTIPTYSNIFNLFDLKYYINQLAIKFNVHNNELYKTSSHELYYYYCECIQHPIFRNLFFTNRYEVLNITKKNIPLMNIFKNLYPKTHFVESNNIFTSFHETCTINHFINCCSTYVNYFNFVVIDLDYNELEKYSIDEVIIIYFCYLLNILATNGSCIINFYFSKNMSYKPLTFELFALLSNSFQYVSLLTPQCSSMYEPQFYFLCRNLQKSFYKTKYMNTSLSLFQNIIYKPENKEVYSILHLTIPLFYKNKLLDLFNQFLYEYTECLQQIYNFHIHYDRNKLDTQSKKRILKAKQWINNYSVVHKHNSLQSQEINQILYDIINVIELCYE